MKFENVTEYVSILKALLKYMTPPITYQPHKNNVGSITASYALVTFSLQAVKGIR